MYSLSRCEGQLKVLLAISRVELIIIKSFGKERMHESTERHPIIPARGEVLEINVLSR